MIAITNDAGESLQLSPGQNLVTEQNVAWLSDEELPGEFSYPIDAPLNEANKRFVSHGYRPDHAQPRTEMAVTVRMEGVLYRRCTFSFRVNSGKLSGYLKIDAAEFYDRIRKLSLLEALPDVVFLGDGLASNPPVSLPLRLKQIAELPPGQFPCTFFPIRNQIQLEESFNANKLAGFVRKDYVNAWESMPNGDFGFVVDLPNQPRFGYLICPQFYLSYVLERIMHLAGFRIESEWLSSPEGQAITIENLTAMNQGVTGLSDFVEGHKLTVGLFLPDISVADFLKAVKGRFGLVMTFNANSRVCRITQFTRTVAAGPALDLTEFQSGDYSTNERVGRGYTVTDYVDESDELYKDAAGKLIQSPAQVIGKGEQPVTLRAGTSQLAYEPSGLSTDALWFVPTVRQAGNVLDPAYKQSDRYLNQEGKRPNSIGLKFLSYRGMTGDSKNNPYPLATPDVRDGKQTIIGSQALILNGRHGAWRNYLRAYFYFRDQTQPITQPLLMPVSVLASLQLDRSVSLSLEDHIRRSYLISKVQADSPGIDGKAIVRLEVLTLPSGIELSAGTDEPMVWVDLLLGEPRLQSREAAPPAGTYPVYLQSLTIRVWNDAARSQAATVTNLPVVIRRRLTQTLSTDLGTPISPIPTEEHLATYFVNGTSTLVENDVVTRHEVFTYLPTFKVDIYERSVQLDPGEGYSIIR